MPKRPDFAESFLYKNWKQQALVKVGDGSALLTALILAGQVLACGGLGLFAGINVSFYSSVSLSKVNLPFLFVLKAHEHVHCASAGMCRLHDSLDQQRFRPEPSRSRRVP